MAGTRANITSNATASGQMWRLRVHMTVPFWRALSGRLRRDANEGQAVGRRLALADDVEQRAVSVRWRRWRLVAVPVVNEAHRYADSLEQCGRCRGWAGDAAADGEYSGAAVGEADGQEG